MNIKKEYWETCLLCNTNIKDIAKTHGGNGTYHSKAFLKHLEQDHNISPEEYFTDFTGNRPICECGECGKRVDISTKGASILWKRYKCGRNEGVKKWSIDAKGSRIGSKNPMFNKKPWNQGLDKDHNDSLLIVSKKMTGRKVSNETRKKQSNSAKKRKFHGHSGRKHTEYSKSLMREATLRRIKDGDFKQTRTAPHIVIVDTLDNMGIKYEEEKVVKYWSFDFYLTEKDIYIEVDGDYFHSNPHFYPDGPKTSTQKINQCRDIKKNKFCKENGMKLLRYWEFDILNNLEQIICELEELSQ